MFYFLLSDDTSWGRLCNCPDKKVLLLAQLLLSFFWYSAKLKPGYKL